MNAFCDITKYDRNSIMWSNVMRSPVIERLMVRGSQVALKHVINDMETRTLVMDLRQHAIKRWVPCYDMDRRLQIPHSAQVECGFRTTPEECLYNSGLIGLHNTIQYHIIIIISILVSFIFLSFK